MTTDVLPIKVISRSLVAVVITALLVPAASSLGLGSAAAATDVHCGSVLTRDTSLDHDVLDCPGDGLVVGADGITVRLNDHEVHGTDAPGSVGIRIAGHDDVTILAGGDFEGLNVSGFSIGVLIKNATADQVRGRLNVEADRYAIALVGASRSIVLNNETGFTSGSLGCDATSPAAILLKRAHGNDVSHNGAELSMFGILLVRSNNDYVDRNFAASKTSDGNNCSGIATFDSDGNIITRNVTANDDSDGIFISGASEGNILSENTAVINYDDGIDTNNAATTIIDNRANRNGDLGIEAVPGVTDGGGNTALNNGDPRQCLNVVCS